MKIKEIYDFLNAISPFSLQEGWDNSGLIVGNSEDEFNEVAISLDIDFDELHTEICDLSSLFQRFGRVNRKGKKLFSSRRSKNFKQ